MKIKNKINGGKSSKQEDPPPPIYPQPNNIISHWFVFSQTKNKNDY